jgi:tellurite resistance protein
MVDPVKLEHFRNLVSLSAADGKIEDAEKESLTRVASSLGIPDERLQVMLLHAHEYIYLIPQNNKDREKQLEEMIDIALVDGNFSRAERELIKSIAHKLGFTHEEAEGMIEQFLRSRET